MLALAAWTTAHLCLGLCPRMAWRSAANAVLACAVMVAVTQGVVRLMSPGLLALVAAGCAGTLTYGAVLLLLGEWRVYDGIRVARDVLACAKGAA